MIQAKEHEMIEQDERYSHHELSVFLSMYAVDVFNLRTFVISTR
jgi:hypothetical protein